MASTSCSRIAEVDHKAKTLLRQLKESEQVKQEDMIALKNELTSKTFKKEVNNDDLFSIVTNLYELIECLEQKISTLSKEVAELKETVKELEELKGDHTQLILGQLAFEVEKAIINEVLTKIIGSPGKHYINTITDMQKALKRKANFADVLADDSHHTKATEK